MKGQYERELRLSNLKIERGYGKLPALELSFQLSNERREEKKGYSILFAVCEGYVVGMPIFIEILRPLPTSLYHGGIEKKDIGLTGSVNIFSW